MVYLGPITTIRPTVKTKATTGYSPEHDMPVSQTVSQPKAMAPYPRVERRQGDRRKENRDPLVESRSNDRRRKGKVDITV